MSEKALLPMKWIVSDPEAGFSVSSLIPAEWTGSARYRMGPLKSENVIFTMHL
jgi:hypothetical protein